MPIPIKKSYRNTTSYSTVFLWLVAYLSLCWIDRDSFDTATNLLYNAVSIVVYILIVHINVAYLVPLYLNQNKIWIYMLLMIVTICLLTPIRIYLHSLVLQSSEGHMHQIIMNWWATLLLDFVIFMCSTIYAIIIDWLAKLTELRTLKQSKLETELNFLKSQINPHFLFNTLNSIYSLSLKKSDKTPEMVLKLADIMRYNLYECNENYVPLQKEIHYLENYIAIENSRFGYKVDLVFDKSGPLDEFLIAPLILNGFVENAFKHGVSQIPASSYIHISAKLENNGRFFFEVENNKPLKKLNTIPLDGHKGGLGLENITRRLQILYPDQHELETHSDENVFNIKLIIQLKPAKP